MNGETPEPGETWRGTALWQELLKREGEPAATLRRVAEVLLKEADLTLGAGDTAPTDFTLHDQFHAARVAERMAAILSEDLSPYDLGMLLLAAYLHDIGMTPPLAKVMQHHDYLLTGGTEILDEEGRDEFQAWLDDNYDGLTPPLVNGTPSPNELRRARRIVAGYTRDRHNDWSEAWIREHAAPMEDELYAGWVSDLVALCKSHHYGLDELRGSEFDPRLVGAPGKVLHLRYCACVLRIADILEFDPERTPSVIYAHRDVDATSAIYWHRDHHLSFALEDGTISIYARPPDAVTHRAIEDVVRSIDTELLVARRLDDETHFDRISGPPHTLPHRWTLETNVHTRIEPLDGRYEYVDGTFRPNVGKVLQLIGGVELYGQPLAAVREMLQNSFDAVREQIARQRLASDEPGSTEAEQAAAALHRVELTLDRGDEGLWLLCRDTGAGMSRDILTTRFLVSGSGPSHEMRELERTCAAHGFSPGRTARFGIGVLSYFLLAARLVLRTRRTIEAGDPDGVGWEFETGGLEDFGELRRAPDAAAGCELRVLLREDLGGFEPADFARRLREYLYNTVRTVPCRFDFEARGFDVEPIRFNPVWPERAPDLTRAALGGLEELPWQKDEPDLTVVSARQRAQIEGRRAYWDAVRQRASDVLRWEIITGELPGSLGRYRLSIPRFELPQGTSMWFFDVTSGEEPVSIRRIADSHAYAPQPELAMSWNGMIVGAHGDVPDPYVFGWPVPGVIAEVDWTSDRAGQIAAHRNAFTPSEAAREAIAELAQRAKEAVTVGYRATTDSPFALANSRAIGAGANEVRKVRWIHHPPDVGMAEDSLLEFNPPIVDWRPYGALGKRDLCWRGDKVTVVPPMGLRKRGHGADWNSWHGGRVPPSSVGALQQFGRLHMVSIWERDPRETGALQAYGAAAAFPSDWSELAGFADKSLGSREAGFTVWNADHPIWHSIDGVAWEWATETFGPSLDPVPHVGDLTIAPSRAAAWLMLVIDSASRDLWEGLAERAPEFLPNVWEFIAGGLDRRILFWLEDPGNHRLRVLTPDAWEPVDLRNVEDISAYLPTPPDEWWLTAEDGDREVFRMTLP